VFEPTRYVAARLLATLGLPLDGSDDDSRGHGPIEPSRRLVDQLPVVCLDANRGPAVIRPPGSFLGWAGRPKKIRLYNCAQLSPRVSDGTCMQGKVRVKKLADGRWRVSVIRDIGRRAVAEGGRDRMLRLALRAASLLPFWDSIPPDTGSCPIPYGQPGRYLVVDPTVRGEVRLPEGGFGKLLFAYQTRELATAFAVDHEDWGGSVLVIDTVEREVVYSSRWTVNWPESPPASSGPRRVPEPGKKR